MSDIFISYSRADRDRAQDVARALGELGFQVWWDRKIPPGKTFDQVIQEALDASDCVVVLWSKTSVASDWVKEEAQAGLAKGALVPVLIDDVPIPLGFGRIQTANLVSWNGDPSHPELDQLARSVAALAGGRIDTRSYRLVREDTEPEQAAAEAETGPPPRVHQPAPRTPRSPLPLPPERRQEPERKPAPPVVKPVTIQTPAPLSSRSQAASGRRLPLVAALVAILVLSVAGVAYYAWSDGAGGPMEVAGLGDDPDASEVTEVAELTVPDLVSEDEPDIGAAPDSAGAQDLESDAGGIAAGMPAPAEIVPAGLESPESAAPGRDGEIGGTVATESKDLPTPAPTPNGADEVPKRVPVTKDESPEPSRRPDTTPAPRQRSRVDELLDRAASPDLPLHVRRDFLLGNLETLGDDRAEHRVGEAHRALLEEMEFSASIIEAKNFVVGSGLVRDPYGTPNGVTGVGEELRPGAVYLFARVRSPASENLKLEWRDGAGRVLASETIQVGRNTDPGYRIGVDHSFTDPGRYEARLYNEKGALIGVHRFEVGG